MKSEAGQLATATNVLGSNVTGKLIPALSATETSAAGAGAGLGAVVLPIALIGAAIVGAAVVVFEFTKKMFDLAQSTAAYGESVFRASQKTGLSIDTISALKIAADRVGLSIETLSTGLVRFTNNLAKAEAGNKTFTNEFAQLGVKSFKDNDAALSEFLAHFGTLRTDQERTVAASQAFGVRTGAAFVEMFNLIGGNMETFKQQLRDLGLLMDTEQAKQAHDFTVRYKQVSEQLSALTRQIGFEVMPVFSAFFTDSSKSLKENQANWKSWGEDVAAVLLSLELLALGAAKTVKDSFTSLKGSIAAWTTFGIGPLLANMKAAAPALADSFMGAKGDTVGGDISGGLKKPVTDFSLPTKTARSAKTETPEHRETMEAFETEKNAIAEIESAYAKETDNLKHEYNERLTAFDEYIARERVANEKRHGEALGQILLEKTDLDASLKAQIIKRAEYDRAIDALTDQKRKADDEHSKKSTALDEEEYKKRIQLAKDFRAAQEAVNTAADADRLAELKKTFDAGLVNERNYQEQIEAVKLSANLRKKQILDDEIQEIIDHLVTVKNISKEEAASSQVVADARTALKAKYEENDRERVAIARETTAAIIQLNAREAASNTARRVSEAAAAAAWATRFSTSPAAALGMNAASQATNLALSTIGKSWEALRKHVRESVDAIQGSVSDLKSVMLALGSVGLEVLNGFADGIGNMVNQWVLLGDQSDASMSKMVATVLAGISAQAASMAVLAFAYGLLALTPWGATFFGPAAADFEAAALFASIALGTGLIGRKVAGGQFEQKPAAAGGASRSGSSAGSSVPAAPTTATVGRNQAPVIHFNPTIEIQMAGFGAQVFQHQVEQAVMKGMSSLTPMRARVIKAVTGKDFGN
jgi:hypothetical protein